MYGVKKFIFDRKIDINVETARPSPAIVFCNEFSIWNRKICKFNFLTQTEIYN